jgi:phosphatidylglycerophosphate synthase
MRVAMAEAVLRAPQVKRTVEPTVVEVRSFDPNSRSSWTNLEGLLEDRFVWLPWNWVTNARALANLPESQDSPFTWDAPTWVSKSWLSKSWLSSLVIVSAPNVHSPTAPVPGGVSVTSEATADAAERFLVARSGKVLDGIHTSFNRRLCRPAVRWLTHTPATPNQVTFGGVVMSAISAMAFARGNYWAYVLGAVLFYLAGLFDEMDGMLARIKFADSPLGTWLEGFADGLSYLFLFVGITIGLYRQYGTRELWLGLALLVGTALALVVTNFQRKRATTADRPNEYLGTFYKMLENDKGNFISRQVRMVHAFQKRGVMIIYIPIFAVLNLIPLVFYLAILGSHLTWIIVLYYNQRFFKQSPTALRKLQAS